MATAEEEARGHGDGERTTSPPAHDQPVRDDLIEPEEVDAERVEEPTMDAEVGTMPDPEELPETQGMDVSDAEQWTEDASSRRLLSDEEEARP